MYWLVEILGFILVAYILKATILEPIRKRQEQVDNNFRDLQKAVEKNRDDTINRTFSLKQKIYDMKKDLQELKKRQE